MSEREQMQRTGFCPRCNHDAAQHRNNQCHAVRLWVANGKGSPHSKCDCRSSGPDDWAAGDAWNAYLGRPPRAAAPVGVVLGTEEKDGNT